MSKCGYTGYGPEKQLVVSGEGKAFVRGVSFCSNVWCCPVCAPRIARKRKGELDRLLAGAREDRLSPMLLTLTFSHNRTMALSTILEAVKRAKKLFRQRREWRALPHPVSRVKGRRAAATVTAMECTFGANGFHPHSHEIILLDCPPEEAARRLEGLRAAWLACLRVEGLSGGDQAFHVQSAAAAGEYVSKFAAASELALGVSKRGRKGSRTPWQLLADAEAGDTAARDAWAEYAAAFRNRRQLVWSPGLKARYLIEETSDAEAAESVDLPQAQERVVRTWASCGSWVSARRRMCSLLQAAETGGDLDAAEFGPTDAERWRRGPVFDDWPER